MTLPAPHDVASQAASTQQRAYFQLVAAEYGALFLASVLSVNVISAAWYIIIYGLVLAGALAALAVRSVLKPEQRWYQGRALAESVKTAAWKFPPPVGA